MHQIDEYLAKQLREVRNVLLIAFSDGRATPSDLVATQQALEQVVKLIENEKASESERVQEFQKGLEEQSPSDARRFCVMVDGSFHGLQAVVWTVENMLTSTDHLHLLTVYASEDFAEDAHKILVEASNTAKSRGVPLPHLHVKSVPASNGGKASDVGFSIQQYTRDCHIDTVVLGSHGQGSIKRSLLSTAGLGSVSDYCVHHLPCTVIVIKGEPQEEEGDLGLGVMHLMHKKH